MKRYQFLLAALLTVLTALSAFAQRPAAQTPTPAQRPPAQTATQTPPANVSLPMSKMGVIYTEVFLDSKDGILKFATLITKLNSEFQKQKDELTQLGKQQQQLETEISKLQSAPAGTPIGAKSIQAKSDQLEQLKRDIQRKGEDAQAAYNRRRAELFQPLQEDIGKALEVFAKARNINVILDGTQVPLIYAADSIDITKAFIVEFNSKNPVTAATTPPR
jgi:outer membrane protein